MRARRAFDLRICERVRVLGKEPPRAGTASPSSVRVRPAKESPVPALRVPFLLRNPRFQPRFEEKTGLEPGVSERLRAGTCAFLARLARQEGPGKKGAPSRPAYAKSDVIAPCDSTVTRCMARLMAVYMRRRASGVSG